MDKNDDRGFTGTLPFALVLTLLAGFIFTYSLPYEDRRPAVSKPLKISYDAAEDVDARLWQDPFVAVNNAETGSTADVHDVRQIYHGNIISDGDAIQVIAVTLTGGPYQDAAEQRMRWRYAVLSALANRNFIPVDEQHIGYFQPVALDDMRQKRVAFEWWEMSEKPRKVLLLWVDEEALSVDPATKLQALLNEVYAKHRQPEIKFGYSVIGPNSSTMLMHMLKEGASPDKKEQVLGEIKGQPIRYYSAAATASDWDLLKPFLDIKTLFLGFEMPFIEPDVTFGGYELLMEHLGAPFWHCATISDCLAWYGVTLYRTTVTDDRLMALLARELEIRGIEHGSDSGNSVHVAVLSEWDSYYGRTMRDAFKSVWGRSEYVRDFSYMRGLDGVLPGQADTNGSVEKNGGKTKNSRDSAVSIEYPEGRNQKDYLRRLAGKIAESDRSLKEKGYGKGIAAIGVLGSDVHDKLMILEALRQYFPHKVFFTTDLDAVYSHPAKWRQTHNMIVASSFDLSLRDELQGNIPPFRDTYQTAMFFTTQLALRDDVDELGLHDMLRPRLFEVGRRRAIPLLISSPDGGADGCRTVKGSGSLADQFSSINSLPAGSAEQAANEKCDWENLADCRGRIHPTADGVGLWHYHWSDFAVVIIAICTIPLVSWQVRKRLLQAYEHLHWLSLPLVAGLLLVAAVLFLHWNQYLAQCDSESNEWLEGVSIWPSQWLRYGAFVFAVGFYFWGRQRINDLTTLVQAPKTKGIDRNAIFALPEYDPNSTLFKDKHCNLLFVGSWLPDKEARHAYLDPGELWQTYLCYKDTVKFKLPGKIDITVSCLRVLFHSLAFFVFVLVLFIWSDRPNTPARGDFALDVNRWGLALSVPATILLTMWVVQNARLGERLINALSWKPSYWNQRAKAFAINTKHIAAECVNEWLDIQLVVVVTKAMQPLIWGPIICTAFIMLARSTAIDDWATPWGLALVFIAMLTYAVSTELYLQRGAKAMRTKVIEQWNCKVRQRRNQNCPDTAAISRIEVEIDNIKALRDGAFRPWYEWPLIQSFGGFGSVVFLLQYLLELLGG